MQVNDFDAFVSHLEKRLRLPLPGAAAHEPMRATPVGNVRPKFDHVSPPKPGSVLILLYPDQGAVKFPLTLRPDYGGTHSGQVSLPGGKAEAGETYVQTALRECEEEIGVRKEGIRVIGRLTDFFVIPSNFIVVPVVGVIERRPAFTADATEVVRILEGDVAALAGADAVKEKEITVANRFQMLAPHFEIDGQVVWGATAMMLNEFRVVVQSIHVP